MMKMYESTYDKMHYYYAKETKTKTLLVKYNFKGGFLALYMKYCYKFKLIVILQMYLTFDECLFFPFFLVK